MDTTVCQSHKSDNYRSKSPKRVLLPLLWMQSKATLSRGHDQPPQSPEGSLATPAAKSGTSGWSHKVVGCCSHSLPHQIPEMYTAVRILRWLFLRYVRTINLSCCLVVDLGSPVCRLSATLPVLANRSLSLSMLRGSAQLVWHWTAFRTETAFACNAIFFKPAAQLDAFKRGQFYVVVAFVLLSTVARLTVPTSRAILQCLLLAVQNLVEGFKSFAKYYSIYIKERWPLNSFE